MSLVSIFASSILPVLAIAAVGVLLGRTVEPAVGPLNDVTLYVLVPALIFHSLSTTTLGGDVLVAVFAGVTAYTLVMVGLAEVVGRLAGVGEPVHSAMVLVAAFPNSGNFGIPLSSFTFGAVGRSTAVVYLAAQSVLVYTLGVYVAARSGGTRGLAGLRTIFELPLIYAVLAAGLARWLGVVPPAEGTAMQTVQLLGDASIPMLLLVLGIELSGTDPTGALREVGLATALKLGVAPVVGVAVVSALAFGDATAARVFVLECATPAAITPLVLLVEFSPDSPEGSLSAAEYVTTVVLVSTLVSVPVLTGLIALLQAGVVV